MCHVAAVLERKAAGEVKRGYIITHFDRLHVQCQLSNLGWLPPGAVSAFKSC